MNRGNSGRTLTRPMVDAARMMAAAQLPMIDTSRILAAAQLPMIDTYAAFGRIRPPDIDLSRMLSGAVDVSGIVSSMLAGADVSRGWKQGSFRANSAIAVPGFDDAVRNFTIEAADVTQMQVSLPDGPILYAPQREVEPLPVEWAGPISEKYPVATSMAISGTRDLGRAIRIYAGFFLFLALLQGAGVVEDGPMPDWAVQFAAAMSSVQVARSLLPKD